jgi:hypothetical protein
MSDQFQELMTRLRTGKVYRTQAEALREPQYFVAVHGPYYAERRFKFSGETAAALVLAFVLGASLAFI